jgi:energy-coupling factor transporter ATP-binding protein EcfA2
MSSEIIRIEHLNFSYPRMEGPLLRDINLHIEEGELVLLTGANGSGKTTLGKCVNGLVPYSTGGGFEGRVETCGLDTLTKSVSELALCVGFVFSNPEDQLATLRVDTEVAFGLSNLGRPRDMILERVDTILDRLGIRELKDSTTFDLSTGQQQLVALASTLAMEPRVLILDDPLSHLNQNTIQRVIAITRELNDRGTTIIWISQDMADMFEWADRIVLLDGGRIAFNGSPRSLADRMISEDTAVIVPQYLELSHALVREGLPQSLLGTSLDQTIHGLRAIMEQVKPMGGRAETRRAHDARTGQPVVRFEGVTFRYPNGFVALKDISLDLYAGDFVLLSGWNGSGKTTLTKHINGLLRPAEGRVCIDGKDISEKPTSELARDVGFLFQNPDHQLHKPTVRDEIGFSLKNFGFTEARIREKVLEVSEKFGLGALLDRSPQELSGSEKKKVTVASVVVYDPRIVVLDEATANLDRDQSRSIIEIIEDYFDENKIIISISHSIRMWADSDRLNRVIVMRDGRIADDGRPERTLCDPDIMGYLYGTLLPVSQIASSLVDKGLGAEHYKTSTLVRDIKEIWRRSSNAPAE